MNKFKPKSIRYRGNIRNPFADCSSIPKVDFSKFDFPIRVIESPMDVHVEKEVFSAIKRVGVNVDRDELLKALNHERDQYAEGYRAGMESAQPKWISVEERLPTLGERVLIAPACGGLVCEARFATSNKWIGRTSWYEDVTHWMPLPEAPKEG